MKKREQKFTTKLNRWIKAGRWSFGSGPIEVKVATGTSLPFSDVKDHQVNNLLSCQRSTVPFKLSDFSRLGTPFDVIVLDHTPGWVVWHFERRGNKEFFVLGINEWISEQQKSKRKSITEERSREIAHVFSL